MEQSSDTKLKKIGNYTMTGKTLGKGHFARVEEAYHTMLKVKVAMKIVNIHEITDEYVKKNFKRETEVMSKVFHPNIIYLFETIETTKHYYIITEIGSGGDLCNFVKSQRFGKLDERRARPLARQLVSAVGHLHEHGIVHRDLKMENILLDYTKERIKLVDFGLSNFCKFDQLLETHCGSAEYAAPELYISGRQYGSEVDVWSLGIIFYGMLVGKLPFPNYNKVHLKQSERQKLLMCEAKIGLTLQHHKNLMELSYIARTLITRILKPDPEKRMTMHEVRVNSWICGNKIHGYPIEDSSLRRKIVPKIADYTKQSFSETYSKILSQPYGPLAGIYNIEKFSCLNRKLNGIYFKCDMKNKKVPNNLNLQHQSPSQYSFKNMSSKDSKDFVMHQKPRPATSGLKFYPNDLKATSNFNRNSKYQCKTSNPSNDSTSNLSKDKTISTTYYDKMQQQQHNLKLKKQIFFNVHANYGNGDASDMAKKGSEEKDYKAMDNKKKSNKFASIKMINYLNAKFSQAFGIYSRKPNDVATSNKNNSNKISENCCKKNNKNHGEGHYETNSKVEQQNKLQKQKQIKFPKKRCIFTLNNFTNGEDVIKNNSLEQVYTNNTVKMNNPDERTTRATSSNLSKCKLSRKNIKANNLAELMLKTQSRNIQV